MVHLFPFSSDIRELNEAKTIPWSGTTVSCMNMQEDKQSYKEADFWSMCVCGRVLLGWLSIFLTKVCFRDVKELLKTFHLKIECFLLLEKVIYYLLAITYFRGYYLLLAYLWERTRARVCVHARAHMVSNPGVVIIMTKGIITIKLLWQQLTEPYIFRVLCLKRRDVEEWKQLISSCFCP